MTRTAPEPAPIPALINYYQRLRNDPNENVPPFGFSVQKISFVVVLEKDGTVHAIEDARRESNNGSPQPISLVTPGQDAPTGDITANSAPTKVRLLRGDVRYMLGLPRPGGDDDPAKVDIAFSAFREYHLQLEDAIADDHFSAVCRFLENWNPQKAAHAPGYQLLEQCGNRSGAFQVRGQAEYVHQRESVVNYWHRQTGPNESQSTDEKLMPSLVSGKLTLPTRLHEPRIKGVQGGQGTQVIVAFDDTAYESYGQSKGENAPMAEDEVFEYCTALNHLLAGEQHRARVGDMTVVFWSDQQTELESVAAYFFGGESALSDDAEHAETTQRVRSFMDALRRGVAHGGLDHAAVPFYILGLSPNAARISVRFWLAGTVGEFADHLAEHVRDLQIVGEREDEPLTLRRLIRETAREARDIPPQLAGEVARAILSGGRYPQMLYSAILRRIRADQTINDRRAAILKACLIRNHGKEVPVALKKDHPDSAYHMGRLFAALEKTQQDALGQHLNRTIKDGYFATASATPAAVFPRLIRMHQHHIEKLDQGLKISREQLLQQICEHVQQFPTHLSLKKQGLFHIGYYHQRQDFFTKRDAEDTTEATASEETTHA